MTLISKNDLLDAAARFTDASGINRVAEDVALRPDLAGFRMYEAPIIGIADASDPCFRSLQAPEVIGPHFILPETWLPGARSVISFFSPFTDGVVAANERDRAEVPAEWLHARIEGQNYINALTVHLRELIEGEGYACLIPPMDKRFWGNGKPAGVREDGTAFPGYTSNWSERHVAYVCGLGTFGLSRGLITAKGMAGRFGSIVTAMPVDADQRPYTRYDEYCTRCGICAANCPADAITLEEGKNQDACSAFCDQVRAKNAPRYGCGKCSVAVPCTRAIPR